MQSLLMSAASERRVMISSHPEQTWAAVDCIGSLCHIVTGGNAMLLQFPGKRRRHGRASAGSGVTTIPQSETGAEQPTAPSASCMTTKVSAGNFTKPFQLKAAPYLRPVNVATAVTPPKMSITSAVVFSSRSGASMESTHNPSFLDKQYPNLIDTKKFGDAALSLPMGMAGTDDDDDVALRCRALTKLYAEGNSRQFAVEIGAEPTRWNGIENSGALSKDVAFKIVHRWPEVSLDWLWRGRDDAYTPAKSDAFLKAFREVAAEVRAGQSHVRAKPTKRRAS